MLVWLGGAGLLLGVGFLLRFLWPRLAEHTERRFYHGLFESKAAALRGADLEVLGVELLPPSDGNLLVRVRVRVTPRSEGRWEPGELALVPASEVRNGRMSLEQVESCEGSYRVELREWDRKRNGAPSSSYRSAALAEQVPTRITGAAEVELTSRLAPGTRSVLMHYYHVLLGRAIELEELPVGLAGWDVAG